MKLDRSALFEIAERLKQSRKMLEGTHQKISQSLEGLMTGHDTVARASQILRAAQVRDNDSPPHLHNKPGSQQ